MKIVSQIGFNHNIQLFAEAVLHLRRTCHDNLFHGFAILSIFVIPDQPETGEIILIRPCFSEDPDSVIKYPDFIFSSRI